MSLSSTIEYCSTTDVLDLYPFKLKSKRRVINWDNVGSLYFNHNSGNTYYLYANGKDLGSPQLGVPDADDEWSYSSATDRIEYYHTRVNPNNMIMEVGTDLEVILERLKRKASRLVESELGSNISREILRDREGNYPTSIIQLTALKTAILFIKGLNPTSDDLGSLETEYGEIKDKIISGRIVVAGHISPESKKGMIREVSTPTYNDVRPIELRGEYSGSNYDLLKIEVSGSYGYDDNPLVFSAYAKDTTKLKNDLIVDSELVNGDFQHLVGNLYVRFSAAEFEKPSGRVFGRTESPTPFTLKEGANGVLDFASGMGVYYNGDDGASISDLYTAGKLENITAIQGPTASALLSGSSWLGSLTTLTRIDADGNDDLNTPAGEFIPYTVTCSADQTGHATTSGGAYIWISAPSKAEYEVELWGANITPTIKQIKSINLSKVKRN